MHAVLIFLDKHKEIEIHGCWVGDMQEISATGIVFGCAGKAVEGGSGPAAQAQQPAAEHVQLPAPRGLSLRERTAAAAQPAAELTHTAQPHDLQRPAMQSRSTLAGIALPHRTPSPIPAADAPFVAAEGDVGIMPEGTAELQDEPHLLRDDAQQPLSAEQVPGCAEAGRARRKRRILARFFTGTSEAPDGVQNLDVESDDDLLEELPCCQRAAALPADRLKPSAEVVPPVEGRDAFLSPGRSKASAASAPHKRSTMPDEAQYHPQSGTVPPADLHLQQEQTAHAYNGGRDTYDAEAMDMQCSPPRAQPSLQHQLLFPETPEHIRSAHSGTEDMHVLFLTSHLSYVAISRSL